DQGLVEVVVAVGQVVRLGALRGERDLVDVEVEGLGTRRDRVVERRDDPDDVTWSEAEAIGDRVGDGALEALARVRVTLVLVPRLGVARRVRRVVRRVGRVVGPDGQLAGGFQGEAVLGARVG